MNPGELVVSPTRLSVTPGYLETMGISLLHGRFFHDGDNGNARLHCARLFRTRSMGSLPSSRRFWSGRNLVCGGCARGMHRARTTCNASGSGNRTERAVAVAVKKNCAIRSRSRARLLARCLARRLRRGPGWAPRDFGRPLWRGRVRHRRRPELFRDRRRILPWRLPGSA